MTEPAKPKISGPTNVLTNYWMEYVKRGDYPDLPINTLPELNHIIWPRRKKLYVIGARPSQGKSAFSLWLACDFAKQGLRVAYLSLEMDTLEVAERIITSQLQVSNYDFRTTKGKSHYARVQELIKSGALKTLHISDCIGKTWQEIDSLIEAMSKEGRHFDAIFVDYMQTVKTDPRNIRESYGEYIRHFREMAIKRDFAAFLVSQVNRGSQEGKDKRPYMHQLKETGVLEEHCDCCMMLWYPYKQDSTYQDTLMECSVQKNKMGRTGSINLYWEPSQSWFREQTYLEEKNVQHQEENMSGVFDE